MFQLIIEQNILVWSAFLWLLCYAICVMLHQEKKMQNVISNIAPAIEDTVITVLIDPEANKDWDDIFLNYFCPPQKVV